MAGPVSPLWLLYEGILAVTVATQVLVGYWVYTRQSDRDGARWFLVMVATGLFWALSFAVFLLPIGPFWQQIAYYGAAIWSMTTIAAFVVFASTYTGRGFHRARPVRLLLGAIVGGVFVLAPTNGLHGLIVAGTTPLTDPFPHIAIHRGPVFTAMVLSIQVPAYYATYVMIRHLLSTARKSGIQLAMFIVGAVTIGTLDAISVYTDLMPVPGITHAQFGLLPFYVLTAVSLFRFGLLDVKPVARNTVFESLRDPVLVVDDRRRVVDYNAAATHVWPDIVESTPISFERGCPVLAAELSIPPDNGGAADRVLLPYDGEDRHYSVDVSGVGSADEETGWYAILLRDVTELEQSRWQLEKQNERLDQVASTISHDLRNPITVIDGHLDLARATLESADLDPAVREDLATALEKIDGSTHRMGDIIQDVLTIAREGKTVEDTERVSLEAVASAAWDQVGADGASLTVSEDGEFSADRSKLLTIFENLFRNAIDHGPPNVTVEVGTTQDGFYVADDGPGIPAEHRDSVFEYGYTTSEEGTGLGLSIVKTMAESHGWTVELDETYTDGTRIAFTVGTERLRADEREASDRTLTAED